MIYFFKWLSLMASGKPFIFIHRCKIRHGEDVWVSPEDNPGLEIYSAHGNFLPPKEVKISA